MLLYGKEYTKNDIMRRAGNLDSLWGARRMTLEDGMAGGMQVIEVWNAAGLRLLLSAERCMDILELSYRGYNVGYLAKNGAVSNVYAHPNTDLFFRYWSGGMLSTCGLRNTGVSNTCDGEFFPLHGHIGITPAYNVGVSVDDTDCITITGAVREADMFGHCLVLNRTIKIPVNSTAISIRDEISNNTPKDEPVFLLYHINFGFPFLDEGVKVVYPEGDVRGATPNAVEAIDRHREITVPIDNEPEQCFFHTPSSKDAQVSLYNESLGFKATVKFNAEKLPVLTEWKSMRSGDYGLGFEPGTCYLGGRNRELSSGYDCCVKAYDTSVYGFELIFSDGE